MNKMDSVQQCGHDKVFAAITWNGAYQWICRKCGQEGTEPVKLDLAANEYETLQKKKRDGGFDGPR